jgi:hypothetical protein
MKVKVIFRLICVWGQAFLMGFLGQNRVKVFKYIRDLYLIRNVIVGYLL